MLVSFTLKEDLKTALMLDPHDVFHKDFLGDYAQNHFLLF
jgi:hypothetical protein